MEHVVGLIESIINSPIVKYALIGYAVFFVAVFVAVIAIFACAFKRISKKNDRFDRW